MRALPFTPLVPRFLKERTRDRVPLGERESETTRLEEAFAAYREALKERTRARVPLDWTFTQMNIALVKSALFSKDSQPRHLDEAIEAADGALEAFRQANATFYIEKAERQREEIRAWKEKG